LESLKSFTKLTNYKFYGLILLFCLAHLLFWGYEGSGNDMIEVVPVLKKMQHPELYTGDFHIEFNESLILHERTFLNNFLNLIGAENPLILFIAYFLCLFAFILGLSHLTEVLGLTKHSKYLSILLILFIAPYSSVGGNELFYNMAVGSCFAKTLGIWCLVFYLRNNIISSFFLLSIATYFQVLAGFQLFLIIGTLTFIDIFSSEKNETKNKLAAIILFCLLCLPYLLALVYSRVKLHNHGSGLFDLLEFRIGHHFLIQYSSIIHIFIFYFLFFSGLYLWSKSNRLIFKFYLLQGVIMLFYIGATTIYKSEFVLQMQWLKTTIWIELFSILALVGLIEKITHKFSFTWLQYCNYLLVMMILCVATVKQIKRNDLFKEEHDLAIWVKNNTNIKSLLVVPPDFTHFKTWSERSSWVDFKAISHQIAYLFPWYDRIHTIYKINLETRKSGINLMNQAKFNYQKIDEKTLDYLFDQQMVNYVILPVNAFYSEQFKVVFHSKSYLILTKKSDY